MVNLKMVLSDGSQIDIAEFGLPMHAIVICADDAEMQTVWAQLTPDKLSSMEIQENGETVFTFSSVTLDGLQCIMNGDGSVTAHFYMSGTNTSAINTEYAEAGKILLGEEE